MPPRRTWLAKFADAFRGLLTGIRCERNFAVHLAFAAAVVLLAFVLRVTLVEWCLLAICITIVLAAELLNTAIERLAHEVSRDHNPEVGAALDMASGSVLITAIGSAIVGSLILGYRCGLLIGWWG